MKSLVPAHREQSPQTYPSSEQAAAIMQHLLIMHSAYCDYEFQ
nr:MAG TPA: hypothetical protein [Caudoviricetes sp.]